MSDPDPLQNLAVLSHMERVADKRVQDAIEKHQLENTHTLSDIHVRLNGISDQIKELRVFIQSGFPHGDPVSHRAVHENYIAEAKARAESWATLKAQIVQWGLLAIIGFICVAVWTAVKEELKK